MPKKVILVTGIGGDIGQSVIKCLNDIGYSDEIIGCDIDSYAAGKKGVKKFFKSPWGKDAQGYLDFIDKLIKDEKINCIFPTSEIEIEFYDTYRDPYASKNVFIFINSSDIIKTFFDKYETVRFLKDNNLPHPRTYLLEGYNNELAFPVLLKPRRGWGGKSLKVVNDRAEFLFYKERMRDTVVQEIIGTPNDEYTVGVFASDKHIYSIAFKRYLGYGSLSKIAHLVFDDEIKTLVEKIAKACSLRGSLNIQMRKTERGYIPLEINPRFSSTVYIRHCFGFQDVKWWIDLKENREISFKPKYKSGVGVRCLNEVFFDLKK